MIPRKNIPFFILSFVLSILLVVFRFNTLHLPFYWDEAWVYGPALREMGEHFCVLPSCASEYVRGHPILFHVIGGIWIKVFGDSLFSLHSFALLITLALQWSLFFIGTKCFNTLTGFLFSLLVLTQNLVFGQATSVFPEILLALFSIWTFYFYLKDKIILYVMFGSLSCLIKEHGVILISSIVAWELIKNLRASSQIFTLVSIRRYLLLAAPVLGLLLFFILQKIQKGYFFFPEHIDMIKTDSRSVIYQLRIAASLLFVENGRIVISIAFLVSFLFFSRKHPLQYRILIPVLIFLLIKILSGKWGFPDWLLLSSTIILTAGIFYILFFLNKEIYNQMWMFGAAFLFIVVYLFFSAFNFYTDRYLASLVPFYIFLFAGSCAIWLKERDAIVLVSGLILSGYSIFVLITYKGYGDISPMNYEVITVQQELTDFLKTGKRQNSKILTSFIMANNLSNPLAGFVNSNDKFTNLSIGCNDTAGIDLVTVFTFDEDSCRNSFIAVNGFIPEMQFVKGKAKGIVYFKPE